MTKLHQVVALCSGIKPRVQTAISDIYHKVQKRTLFDGLQKNYRPKDEEGERLPGETHKVQEKVTDLCEAFGEQMVQLFDIVATQELSNTVAMADVVVDGETILQGIPLTALLFLEKQLTDVKSFIGSLPTLDPSEEWEYNSAQDLFSTKMRETARTKKTPRVLVKYEATDKHPAQVDVWHEDVLVGFWQTTNFSGAIPVSDKNDMLARTNKLIDAVKVAREKANEVEAIDLKIGRPIFEFVFGPSLER